jgi:hypothetical protein
LKIWGKIKAFVKQILLKWQTDENLKNCFIRSAVNVFNIIHFVCLRACICINASNAVLYAVLSLILEKFNNFSITVYYSIFKIGLPGNVCCHRRTSREARSRSRSLTTEGLTDMLPERRGLLEQTSMCKRTILERMTRCGL